MPTIPGPKLGLLQLTVDGGVEAPSTVGAEGVHSRLHQSQPPNSWDCVAEPS